MVVGGIGVAGCSSSPPSTPSPSLGIVQNRIVPPIPLVNEKGQPTALTAFRGKTVILAPFMTLCQETCPLTTDNLLLVQRAVDAAGLGGKVQVLEYSVDPGRDTPARLTAYAHMTGASWPLLTGTQSNISALNAFFHFYAQKVPEGSPPEIDWWTHEPLTYDINHSDGYVLIDPQGHERFETVASPDVTSHKLPKVLSQLLDAQGHEDLTDPSGQTWTVLQALAGIGWLLKQNIPATT
jgi:cytochrome oxidase Cu insertion factor (SCO1/SenC/PrrC family)